MAKKNKAKFGDSENILKSLIIDGEYATAKSNSNQQIADFEAILDMIENVRSEKNYEWQSDVFIGVMCSHLLTDTAMWAQQDFQTRDFCEVYLEGTGENDKKIAQAAKLVVNGLLNIKDIYHFHKRIRGRMLNWMFGQVYAVLWWEKETRKKMVPQPPIPKIVPSYDEQGNIVTKIKMEKQPDKEVTEVIVDRFNYDVFDHRNVFTDFSYCYSVQQKPFVILRSEKTWEQLKKDEEKMGYFNLNILKERIPRVTETETSAETYNKLGGKDGTKTPMPKPSRRNLDILDRYGEIWAKVTERDEDDLPVTIEPAYDSAGFPDDKAELVEAIVTWAGTGGNWTMIGFRPTWAIDSNGKPYKPIVRGWHYIHPTKDIGLSDGKNLRELNVALNDTFNISNDRVMLATLPVLMGRKDALENNPTVYIEPEHIIELENIETDLRELRISDNISGALEQIGFLKSTASEMDATWGTTMGGLPEKTSTTATAVHGADVKTSVRGNLKSLTWNYSFDIEFYSIMLQMAYRFAEEETLVKLVGEELAPLFDPNADYTWVPLSQNIEAEQQKFRRVGLLDQMVGRLMGLVKVAPKKVIPIITQMTAEVCEILGGNMREYAPAIRAMLEAPINEEDKGPDSVKDGKDQAMSNQSGSPMSGAEMATRDSMAGGGIKS